jgi:hypothetical protein
MTIGELIQKLQQCDPNQMAVVLGYEGGFDELAVVRGLRLTLNAHEECYFGQHEECEAGDVAAVLLAGSDGSEWRYRLALGLSDQNW